LRTAALVRFGLFLTDTELALNLFGDRVAAVDDVARERGGATSQNVERGERCAHVQQHHGLLRGWRAVSHLEAVLHRECIQVDDLRLELGFERQVREIADLFFLGSYEQHVHLALLLAPIYDLIVDLHIGQFERDVLLSLPVDLLGQLCRCHERHRDLLDDHAMAADTQRDVATLDLVEESLQPFHDRARVHDVTIHDGLRRQRVVTEPHERTGALAVFLDLAELDGARAYINADEVLAFGGQRALLLLTEHADTVGKAQAEGLENFSLGIHSASQALLHAVDRQHREIRTPSQLCFRHHLFDACLAQSVLSRRSLLEGFARVAFRPHFAVPSWRRIRVRNITCGPREFRYRFGLRRDVGTHGFFSLLHAPWAEPDGEKPRQVVDLRPRAFDGSSKIR
jgi:hypothetical protein